MASVEEIERAIAQLSTQERRRLVLSLPTLLPELDGDLIWEMLTNEHGPRRGLSAAIDDLDAQFAKMPESFPEVKLQTFGDAK